MGIVRHSAKEAKKLRGDSDDERLANMTDEEIEEAAKSDPDSALPTEEQLKKFKRVVPRGDGVYAHSKKNK